MGSTEVEIISGAGSGAEVRSMIDTELGSGPGFVSVEILGVGVVVGSKLGAVGFGLKSISGSEQGQGFASIQSAMTGSLSETGLG